MTQTHTPGPWHYSFESVDPNWAIVMDRSGGIVANVNHETGPDAISAPATRKMPKDANARLIAAAPDMLAALQAAMNVMRSDPHAREARAIAAAAIAKATGEK